MELDFNSFDESLNDYQKIYESLIEKTLKHLSLSFDPYISVAIVNNDYIHQINRDYRHKDAPTDVISFAFLDDNPNRDELFQSGKTRGCRPHRQYDSRRHVPAGRGNADPAGRFPETGRRLQQ